MITLEEVKIDQFKKDNHLVRVWEDCNTKKRHIELIDKRTHGRIIFNTKEEVVSMLEMLVKAGVTLDEGRTN